GFHGRADHYRARLGSPGAPLIRLFVQQINRRPQILRHTALVDLFHHSDDGVPITLLTRLSELESSAERRATGEVAFGKRLVDDDDRHAGPAVGWVERTALAQLRSHDRKVIAAHHPKQR